MLTGLTSTLSDGATAWMAANWPVPEAWVGIPKDRRSRHARRDLLEQLQPFPAHAVFESHETGGVAARPRQAVDEAGADRIGDDREHDRHGAGRLQQRPHGRGAMGQDDVGRERGQFRRVSANVGGIGSWPSGCRSARCGRWSSPIAPAPAGTPRRGPEIPDRPRLRAGARRCAASARPAARAPRAATLPPRRRAA